MCSWYECYGMLKRCWYSKVHCWQKNQCKSLSYTQSKHAEKNCYLSHQTVCNNEEFVQIQILFENIAQVRGNV